MPKICYQKHRFSSWKLEMIKKVNNVVRDYKNQGYSLTLRQVYYQFVANDWLPEIWADKETGSTNNQRAYNNLGEMINFARLSGLVDWNAIEDRTRELSKNSHWDNPSSVIESAAYSYGIDLWQNQPYRVEVWVEKDALEGVISKPCTTLDVAYFSCRGYTSQTAMWDAGRRLRDYAQNGQQCVILHLGDHDPSGIDMSRDIEDRIRLFMGSEEDNFTLRRIALNMDQIRLYNPPPNPAKITDSRAEKYIEKYGEESWELDALEPSVIDSLITTNVLEFRDESIYKADKKRLDTDKKLLDKAADNWDDVADYLKENFLDEE